MIRTACKAGRWPLLLLCFWMVTLVGVHSTPLEDHEVLVLQTAREMEGRGDWVLPSFNAEWRLNKPPFNYWATAVLCRLDPAADTVQARHGRFVSLLAGLGMALATWWAGRALFGPVVGKLASLLLLSAQGCVNLAHNARPDLLYSTFGVLQLFAWMAAWRAEDGSRAQRGYGWLGWGMAGLATLTKGPQVPAVFLAGTLGQLLSGPDRGRTLRVLRPLAGIPFFCALVLPWWFLLQRRLETLKVDLSDTQLSGSLLHNLAGWKELLSFYYPLTLFSLMIPVSLIVPFLLPRLWRMRQAPSAPVRFLLWAGSTLLVVFTLGGHYRKHYLLPLLPLASLLLARALEWAAFPRLSGWRKRLPAVALGLVAVVCLGLALRERAWGALSWIALCGLPIGFLLREELRVWDGELFTRQLLKATAVLVPMVAISLAYLPSGQDRWRRAQQAFAEHIGETLRPGDRIVQWRSDSFILPFFAERPVTRFDEAAELEAFLRGQDAGRAVYAVVPRSELPTFAARFPHRVLRTVERPRHPEKALVFTELETPRP